MAGTPRARQPKNPLSCHDRALRLLAVRPRSRRELERRLLQAGFDGPEVADELARLEAVGLVDDEAFAKEYAGHALSVKRAGRRAVTSALLAKGIDRRTADRVLGDMELRDEEARALELAGQRAGRFRALEPEAAFRRLASFLIRRGYDPAVARRASRVALGIEAGDE